MPIEKKQWNEGMSKNEVEILIRTFLKQKATRAHSCEEIWAGLNFEGDSNDLRYYLRRLCDSDIVDIKLVKTETGQKCYYMSDNVLMSTTR